MSNSERAFQELSRVFSSRGSRVFEIEIIPPSLGSSFLQDECAVGITKKALIQAFTVARRLFIDRLLHMSDDDFRATLVAEKSESGQLVEPVASEVILLFDCEHLTACNWRKRWLLHGLNIADRTSAAVQILETELTLMTTYQCSPLHRHTKSPTLWHHRLWVLRQLFRVQPRSMDALLELQRAELAIVLRAAELHPRNYYAFSYMRQLHALLDTMVAADDQPRWAAKSAPSMVEPVLDWCLAHPRDISGWIFGIYLLDHSPEQQVRKDAVSRVLRFARDVRWEGESLWTFIDQAVRQFELESVVEGVLRCDQKASSTDAAAVVHDPVLQKRSWLTLLGRARAYWAVYG